MRDGIRLFSLAYFPAGKGPWPALFQQYHSPLIQGDGTRLASARLAAKGYVVFNVNFRGSQVSEGTWSGYRALGWGEHRDGYDTCEWLAVQSWCDGKVGTFGPSQAGIAQNFLAVTQPPHLRAQYMIDTGLSLFHEAYRVGGTTRPQRFRLNDRYLTPTHPEQNVRLIAEWFEHPLYDDYWAAEDCTRHFGAMNIPCCTIGSWYDYMCTGSIQSFIGRQHQGGPRSRGQQRLIIGPWSHAGAPKSNKVGQLEYPPDARFDLYDHVQRWFDHHLKGISNGIEKEAAVRYYVMGAVGEAGAPGNVWRQADDWPVKALRSPYYLNADGILSGTRPTAATTTNYLSDPLHPATLPGVVFAGAQDARPFESQPNVLTFTTAPLSTPVEWTGLVTAELFVSSTARDTDFIVRVSDVYPDGRSMLLIDAVRRARYRDGFDREVFMREGDVYPISFDVGWLSIVFNAGHRIRVTVSSNAAPFYEVNPNTGDPLTPDPTDRMLVARNSLHHGGEHASRIVAPVAVSLPDL
ncbi:MAG: CocE/NonD family hydrolase [Opitutus sp.]|nr:CocE/NonD family hydrolase [Opitutus sp.]